MASPQEHGKSDKSLCQPGTVSRPITKTLTSQSDLQSRPSTSAGAAALYDLPSTSREYTPYELQLLREAQSPRPSSQNVSAPPMQNLCLPQMPLQPEVTPSTTDVLKPRPILKRQWILELQTQLAPISELSKGADGPNVSSASDASLVKNLAMLQSSKETLDGSTTEVVIRSATPSLSQSRQSVRNRIFYNSSWNSRNERNSTDSYEEDERQTVRVEHQNYWLPKYFDSFVLEELIGKGSFANVYRAYDKDTRTNVAIKSHRIDVITGGFFARVAKEIVFLRILTHPNIIAYRCSNIRKRFTYIGMECTQFGSLKNFIKEKIGLQESLVQSVISQLLSAVYYLHTMSIFHGDIKPENILIAESKRKLAIKLTDFGLATVILQGQVSRKRFGSFYYMAPEIHLKHPFDYKADLFSVGVVMYEMLFGTKPLPTNVKREHYIRNLKRKIEIKFPVPQVLVLSPHCVNILKGLLNYNKLERPTAASLLNNPFMTCELVRDQRDHHSLALHCFLRCGDLVKQRRYGAAYTEITAAIVHFQIHSTSLTDEALLKYVSMKIEKYNIYCRMLEHRLMHEKNEPMEISTDNETLRCLLEAAPNLRSAFDICTMGEMYYLLEQRQRGGDMIRAGFNALVSVVHNEPNGQRKQLLLIQLEEWNKILRDIETEMLSEARGM